MERSHEEKAQTQEESPCSGARPVGRTGPQRCQETRQQGEWAQGRLGQKPPQDFGRPAQCAAAPAWSAQAQVNAAIASVRDRFGYFAIGLGYSGLRYIAPVRAGRSAG